MGDRGEHHLDRFSKCDEDTNLSAIPYVRARSTALNTVRRSDQELRGTAETAGEVCRANRSANPLRYMQDSGYAGA
jgi:hypothetical protein